MAKPIINPQFVVFNTAESNPDFGATIDTYSTGASTTRRPTYYDSALTVAQQNPIDTNSETLFPNIYGDPATTYRLVIKNNSGTTLVTADGITGLADQTKLDANLDVSTFSIVSTSNGNIPFTSSSQKYIVLDGLQLPAEDGNNTQILQTDASGILSWVNNGIIWSIDTTPQLGGTLDGNSYSIKFDSNTGIKDENGNEQLLFTQVPNAVNYLNFTNSATTDPVLIEAAGSDTDIGITISSKGTKSTKIDAVTFPSSDGSEGSMLKTNGSAALGFHEVRRRLIQRVVSSTASEVARLSVEDYDIYSSAIASSGVASGLSQAITPTSAASTIRVKVYIPNIDAQRGIVALNSDKSSTCLVVHPIDATGELRGVSFIYEENAASTSQITYTIKIGGYDHQSPPGSTGSITILDATYNFGGVSTAYLIVEEYL